MNPLLKTTLLLMLVLLCGPSHALTSGSAGPWKLGQLLTECRTVLTKNRWLDKRKKEKTYLFFKESQVQFSGASGGTVKLLVWNIAPPIGRFRHFRLFFSGGVLLRISAYYREVKDVAEAGRALQKRFGKPSWKHNGTQFWVKKKSLGASIAPKIGRLQWVDLKTALKIGLLSSDELVAPALRKKREPKKIDKPTPPAPEPDKKPSSKPTEKPGK